MTEQVCRFCGDGPDCVGTMNHIECVEKLMGTASIMRENAVDREKRIAELEAELERNEDTMVAYRERGEQAEAKLATMDVVNGNLRLALEDARRGDMST